MPDEQDALAETLWGVWGSNKSLRHEFMFRWIGWNLARQIKAMRKSRGWTQGELATRSGLSLLTIGRYEKNCCHARINGLVMIAAAFDVALVCRFTPFSEILLVMARDGVFVVPRTFDQELAAMAFVSSTSRNLPPRIPEGPT